VHHSAGESRVCMRVVFSSSQSSSSGPRQVTEDDFFSDVVVCACLWCLHRARTSSFASSVQGGKAMPHNGARVLTGGAVHKRRRNAVGKHVGEGAQVRNRNLRRVFIARAVRKRGCETARVSRSRNPLQRTRARFVLGIRKRRFRNSTSRASTMGARTLHHRYHRPRPVQQLLYRCCIVVVAPVAGCASERTPHESGADSATVGAAAGRLEPATVGTGWRRPAAARTTSCS
jgi:hypothetical protein